MMNWTRSGFALAAVTLLSANAWAGDGPSGHSHSHDATFSAGEPGNPKKPARIVQVTMGESDGKMLFVPSRLEVRKGGQIKFVLRNTGELEHEFVLAGTADNLNRLNWINAETDNQFDLFEVALVDKSSAPKAHEG